MDKQKRYIRLLAYILFCTLHFSLSAELAELLAQYKNTNNYSLAAQKTVISLIKMRNHTTLWESKSTVAPHIIHFFSKVETVRINDNESNILIKALTSLEKTKGFQKTMHQGFTHILHGGEGHLWEIEWAMKLLAQGMTIISLNEIVGGRECDVLAKKPDGERWWYECKRSATANEKSLKQFTDQLAITKKYNMNYQVVSKNPISFDCQTTLLNKNIPFHAPPNLSIIPSEQIDNADSENELTASTTISDPFDNWNLKACTLL